MGKKYRNLLQVPESVIALECGYATYSKSIKIKKGSEISDYTVGAVLGRYWQDPYLNGENKYIFTDYSG